MSAPRFYCPPPLIAHGSFELPQDAAHHASRVLRLRVNDPVQLFDGEGNALDAVISEMSGKRVVLGELKSCNKASMPQLHIVLVQAMCSSEKMDWIVQKATELGVAEIQPVQTQRSVAKLTSERAEKRAEHWRSVIVAACEQCGRNTLAQAHLPQDFSTYLANLRSEPGVKFILQPEGASTLHQHLPVLGKVFLLIGPEGGFSADEMLIAHQVGFAPILLGPRVLRTETAAIAGITALQTLWGDFC